ncbi:NmrA family transcriptional regulator [Xanthomonas citri pv. fuscans]|uniref:NmrA family transcriptional regulator n=1 Tax=Xanthomonas citri pv. fuscans TaxID=366649 RepID=A0AB34Q3I2_XANCI|nr:MULTISPECIES: SDR family oxidoreductase [Xanthomonas]ATB56924.1 NAD(P)-binding domain superfamily protein [Xanthomonas citri pv. fuscans]ATS65167.1 SDR family oxidoreductase [Xanthomonas citri pv. phaseoli var. fuscans]ATS66953.1 SDR family oxidoreductase [Xanthomonas citri pv. phaseoli var. fuscans]ATS73515.1 SDR family oxidoreductase [Xanthomonas citri pv. phaseoli var. fuscans]ATS76355.1 SDR family oxidoreductase [Xanthomonas citri pv. phaseoli var. fuscans]
MTSTSPLILVTGASGQLGALVVEALLGHLPANRIVATARDTASLAEFAKRDIAVRQADYANPQSLDTAFAGVGRVLLVSSNAVGQRVPQHRNVIEAAKRAGVELLAYTSILHADTSTLSLAAEHVATEALLRESGVPHALLRNGWYTENYTGSIAAEVAHGAVLGSAGDGRISATTRADYAAAAAAVLASDAPQAGQVYELAGDTAFTMAEYAAEVAQQSGKPVAYHDLPEADYAAALVQIGLPAGFAQVLAQCSAASRDGALFDDRHTLGRLIGRPTTPLRDAVAAALAAR